MTPDASPMAGHVTVNSLSKKFKRYPSGWARLAEWLSGGRRCHHHAHWALRGVTLAVQPGESVGIIGQNGAGKSTLLKILTGTTRATEGEYRAGGRISALLELGMGFHSDFTGRQNAVIGCQMLGLNAGDIERSLPEIAAFSELADYMEQPLRTYSTGMHMRLAFSVATVARPDILIIDEALSVGDTYFQHKSMKRIRSFRDAGTTLLFVSHDPGAVKSVCGRAVLLDQGILIREGSPDTVLDYYNALIARRESDRPIRQTETAAGTVATRSGNNAAEIVAVELTDAEDRPCRLFQVGHTAKLRCTVRFHASVPAPTVGMLIRDRLGNDVFGTNTHHLSVSEPLLEKGSALVATFVTELNVGPGNYSVSVAVHEHADHLAGNMDWWDQAVAFQVVPGSAAPFTGTAMLPIRATLEKVTDGGPA